MSQAEALLQNLVENVPTHSHVVTDNDSYFVINPDTHEIENASRTKNIIMQGDHNSEKFTFELARYVEGHDMILCNRVRVHFNNIDGETLEENADVAELYDLAVCPDDENKVLCSWSITRQATQLVGTLNFLVQYECIDDDGNSVYEWHTDIYDDVVVKKSRNNSEQAIIEYSNILEQWYQRIFGTGESVLANISSTGEAQISSIISEGEKQVAAVTAAGVKQVSEVSNEGAAQKEAITLKGEETLATIPAEYTTTYNMAEEALRKKANAIELEAEGETIFVDDSSDSHLLGLKVLGKTEQFTTTGKQLWDATAARNFVSDENGWYTWAYDNSTSDTAYYYQMNHPTSSLLETDTDYLVVLEIEKDEHVGFELVSSHNSLSQFASNVYYAPGKLTKGPHVSVVRTTSDFSNATTMLRTVVNVAGGYKGTVKFRISVYKDTSLTANTFVWEPYTGGVPSPNPEYPQELESIENPIIDVCGKNLIRNNMTAGTSETKYGVTFTVNSDKSIHVSGTPTQAIAYNIMEDVFLPAGTYCLSGAPDNASTLFRLQVNHKPTIDGIEKTGGVNMETPVKFTIPYDGYVRAYIYASASLGPIMGTFYPQLELGDTATEYESYKPVQSLAVNRTLYGIPVTSGGNYTDSNSQQWICDEIDFDRGVLIQRTKVIDLAECGTWSTWGPNAYADGVTGFYHYPNDTFVAYDVLCTTFKCEQMVWGGKSVGAAAAADYIMIAVENSRLADVSSNDAAINSFKDFIASVGGQMLVAINPIETPLTEEELAYYKKLKTNYHNTTVMNDHNAHMSIKYAADTLIYLRDHQPKPTDEQIQSAVNEYASQNGVQVPSDDHIREITKESVGEVLTDEEVASLLALLD